MTKRKSDNPPSTDDQPMPSRFKEESLYLDERPVTEVSSETHSHFRGKKFKNSLDSDEEDDEVEATKYNMLDPEDLEGQEERTIERDGEIKITPFNMNEELEEGHFDKEGTFIFHKDPNEIKDSWLDNIDWVKLKERNPNAESKEESESDDEDDEVDSTETYKAMLEIMQPKETVQKALQRLGGKSMTASSRWKKKDQISLNEEDIDRKEKLMQLISLANTMVSAGHLEIYQQTYERLNFLVTAKTNPPPKFEATSDAGDDMFSDDFDAKKVSAVETAPQTSASGSSSASPEPEVRWEFKWENNDQAEIYGPHPTSEIMRWIEEGYFGSGVWVRKVGEVNAPFYSSNRVDFELYT